MYENLGHSFEKSKMRLAPEAITKALLSNKEKKIHLYSKPLLLVFQRFKSYVQNSDRQSKVELFKAIVQHL